MNDTISHTAAPAQVLEKLVYTGREVNELLGGISDVTRWRLEKKGLLKRVPGVPKPIYTKKSVLALASGEVTA